MTARAASPQRPLRVVLWGTCDMGKPRVRLLREGLAANGVEVIACHADVWTGIEDKSQLRGARRWLPLLATAWAYPKLLWRYLRLPAHDWVLVAYPAVLDIFAIAWLARLRGVPVAMDWFLSAYDTVVLDRRLVGPRHPLAWMLWGVEWLAARVARRPFMDTAAHARRMEQLYRLPAGRVGRVWVGAESGRFAPETAAAPAAAGDQAFTVLFYGQFIPLHGIEVIVQAARALRDRPIRWVLIGTGQEAARMAALLDAEPLPRLQWIPWIPYAQLREHIAAAQVCLGIFGTSDKAASVIPNKVFQVLCAGRPLITRDSPAVRELLPREGADCDLIPAGDPAALAAAVLRRHARHATVPPATPSSGAACIGAPTVGLQFLEMLQATPTKEDIR